MWRSCENREIFHSEDFAQAKHQIQLEFMSLTPFPFHLTAKNAQGAECLIS